MLNVSRKNFQGQENLLFPPVQNRHMRYDVPARQESLIPPFQNGNLQYNAHAATTLPRSHQVLRTYLLLINLIRTKNII